MEANTKLREGVNIRNRDETHELFEEFQHSNAYYSGYEGDDEVFVEFDQLKPGDREEVRQPRVRRISDVIDSIGEMSSSLGRSHSLEFSESTSISSETSKVIECSTIRETSRFIITEVDGKEKLLSPPATPSSDLGYYSTGISTPPSQLNFKGKLFRFSNSSMEAASPPKWDTTDAKPYSGYASRIRVQQGIMPVDRESEEYNMNHLRRGYATIFNHDEFSHDMPTRKGSHIDVQQLTNILEMLHFEVKVYNNLDCEKIREVLNELASMDHSDCDCLLVAVLTHGLKSNYLYAKDYIYSVDTLWLPFTADRCLSLAGKPKMFLIQACRGEALDAGVRLVSTSQTDSGNISYKIPSMADFFIAYSTAEGYYSWRHPEKGTWFIQSFCQVLNDHYRTLDFQKIMTRVSHRVAIEFESYNDCFLEQHEQKQVPNMHSTLIRDVYFRPKV